MKRQFTKVMALLLVILLVLPSGTAFAAQGGNGGGWDPDIPGYNTLKVDFPVQEDFYEPGSYEDNEDDEPGSLSVELTVEEGFTRVKWVSDVPVSFVFVKGGNDEGRGILYPIQESEVLNPFDPPVKSGDMKASEPHQISHITFYYHEETTNNTYSISGYKFNDANNNHEKDTSEQGIENWPIKLYKGAQPSPASDNPIATQQTTSNGSYNFSGLEAGTYYIYEGTQSDWTQTYPKINETSPDYYEVTLVNQNVTEKNFLNHEETTNNTYSISGYKFNDANNNHEKDTSEQGIENWPIKLYKGAQPSPASDNPIATQQTTSNGSYNFSGLEAGTYYIYEGTQSDWTQTYPKINETSPDYYEVTLVNQNVTEKNFLNYHSYTNHGNGGNGDNGDNSGNSGKSGTDGGSDVIVPDEPIPLEPISLPPKGDPNPGILNKPIVEIIDELVPGGPAELPKTGGIPSTMFYGFGGLLAAAGAFIRRKFK